MAFCFLPVGDAVGIAVRRRIMQEERTPPEHSDDPVSRPRCEPLKQEPVSARRREVKVETEERTPEEAGYGYGV
jgi:hypothetical protein